ncbi:DUF3375 domain-containing protein [Sulfurimonas sp. SWIR-19]|uniref:DUF3375 domain-containing protein n=1 Tax=Sulfurimonas sp. SWIR-19 TaxID=2878390 RepID=UPI001CF15DEB|nr:DUF3375 domain-containing protein [Sulfurimonas sp. SWIR-19]UCN00026.1 DUF3375 domain-containing protein [Sulfurimonas sp. SWIR-19]
MTYQYLKNLKTYNQTIKLLHSDNFAMMVGFFHFVFVQKRHVTLNHTTILAYLEDYLYDIHQSDPNAYPKDAKAYLDDFVSDKNGYLKRYQGSEDEAMYELTPHTQKVFEFLESLQQREFVGSRTKFNIIFELLEELEFETHLDDAQRIAALEAEKRAIDERIAKIKAKEDLRFDSSRIKEHFMLIEEQSRKLKYDFAQIEYNFRELNHKTMVSIANAEGAKAGVLDSIFESEEQIRQSDQGKSFFAFWQILTDAQKNEKLSQMLEKLYAIDVIKEFDKHESVKNLKHDLLLHASKITKVSSKLIEQLRRFIDNRVWIENKKILELCKNIEKTALEIKEDAPTKRDFYSMMGSGVKVDSVFEKGLYQPKEATKFHQEIKQDDTTIVDLESFYNLFYVDEALLQNNINTLLQLYPQVTLQKVVEQFPITKGISELVGYLSLVQKSEDTIIEMDKKIKIKIDDAKESAKWALVPNIIITRGEL